jgi:predicted dehydrogenase
MINTYGWVVGFGHMGALHHKKLSQFRGVEVEILDPLKSLKPKRDDPQFAIVATPAHTHIDVAGPLLERGIPVLIEKPLATCPEDSKRLAQFPNCFVGHIERFNPVWKHISTLKPRFIQSDRMSPFSKRSTDINVALDLMIHDIDLILALDHSPVQDVRAIGMGLHTDLDLINARIETKQSVIQLTASRISKTPIRQFRIFTEKAYWSADLHAHKLQCSDWSTGERVDRVVFIEKSDPLESELRCFLNQVWGKGQFPVTGKIGHDALMLATQLAQTCQ